MDENRKEFFRLLEGDLGLPLDCDCFEDFVEERFVDGVMDCRAGEEYGVSYFWSGNGVFAICPVSLFPVANIFFIPVHAGMLFLPRTVERMERDCFSFSYRDFEGLFGSLERMRGLLCREF